MRIILTGASSFLGRAVTERLRAAGHEVFPLRHSFEEAETALPQQADVWLHFAWAGVGSAGRSDARIQNFNVDMSMAALRKAAALGCGRFVFAGSQAEYGPGQGLQCEDAICRPVSAYGKAKAAFGAQAATFVQEWNRHLFNAQNGKNSTRAQNAEHVQAAGTALVAGGGQVGTSAPAAHRPLQFIHLRIFSVYGPGDHETALIPSCIRAFLNNAPMDFGPCTQDWNYLYIDDAAAAIQLLTELPLNLQPAERQAQETQATKVQPITAQPSVLLCNVAGQDTRPLRSYIEELKALCKSDSPLHFGVRQNHAEGAADLRPDTTKLQRLGFYPQVSFAEGIRRCIEAERKQGET